VNPLSSSETRGLEKRGGKGGGGEKDRVASTRNSYPSFLSVLRHLSAPAKKKRGGKRKGGGIRSVPWGISSLLSSLFGRKREKKRREFPPRLTISSFHHVGKERRRKRRRPTRAWGGLSAHRRLAEEKREERKGEYLRPIFLREKREEGGRAPSPDYLTYLSHQHKGGGGGEEGGPHASLSQSLFFRWARSARKREGGEKQKL